jgi:hypothetical protein
MEICGANGALRRYCAFVHDMVGHGHCPSSAIDVETIEPVLTDADQEWQQERKKQLWE